MAGDERRTIAEFTEEFLRLPKRPEPTRAEILEEIRSALELHHTITRVTSTSTSWVSLPRARLGFGRTLAST